MLNDDQNDLFSRPPLIPDRIYMYLPIILSQMRELFPKGRVFGGGEVIQNFVNAYLKEKLKQVVLAPEKIIADFSDWKYEFNGTTFLAKEYKK